MSDHAPTQCDTCGQTDDHPKLHYGVDTFHHDCLPHRVHIDVTAHPVTGPVVAAIVDAAKGGTRGQDLRDHIAALHDAVGAPAAVAHLDPADVAALAAPAVDPVPAPAADPVVEASAPAAPAAPVVPSEG